MLRRGMAAAISACPRNDEKTNLEDVMNKLVLMGLVCAVPMAANAFPRMESPRQQIKDAAKAAGVYSKGERLTVKTLKKATMGKPGEVEATVWSYGYVGPLMQNMKKHWMKDASAKFRVTQDMEGQSLKPIKQYGEVWQHYAQALAR